MCHHKKLAPGGNSTDQYVTVYYGPSKVKLMEEYIRSLRFPIAQLPLEYQEK